MNNIIYKFRPTNNHTIDELKNNYLYFSGKDNLNDPEEGKLLLLSESDFDATVINNWLNSNLKNYLPFISSFSEECNPNMFHKYGDICLFFQTYYFNKKLCLRIKDGDNINFRPLQKIKYQKNNPVLFSQSYNEIKNNLLRIKNEEWNNEKEVRLISYKQKEYYFKEDLIYIMLSPFVKKEYKDNIYILL